MTTIDAGPVSTTRRVRNAFAAHPVLLAASAYLAYAVFITWPFALHPTSTLYGLVGLDLTGGIGWANAFAEINRPPFIPGVNPLLDAPDGLNSPWTLELASLPSSALTWVLASTIGGVAGSGVFILTNLAGSALAMFLLARRITGSAPGAFVAGLAFGFWPYQFAYAAQPLTSGWVLVLAFWRALRLVEEPTWRNGLWMGLSAVLVVAWIQYWMLIGGVLLVTLGAVALIIAWRRRELRRAATGWAVATAIVVAWFGLLGTAVLASGGNSGSPPVRDAADSVRYSARPAMYVVPSGDQPIVGRWTGSLLADRYEQRDSVAEYSPIYFGLSVLALATLGLIAAWPFVRAVWRRRARSGTTLVAGAGALAAALLVPVGLLWSAPPELRVLGIEIWTPSHVVLWFTTVFRSTARFAEIAMLGLALLSAFGVARLLRGRTMGWRVAITGVLTLVVGADLWARQAPGPQRFRTPAVTARLAELPPGALAVYPIVPAAESSSDELFFRSWYDKPLFNWYLGGTDTESAKIGLASPLAPRVPGELRRLGVKYVMVKWYNRGEAPPGYPERGSPIPGLRLVTDDGTRTVYEISAPRARWILKGLGGLTRPEGDLRRPLRWITEPAARLELSADCAPCVGRLSFGTGTYILPRTLTVKDDAGRVLASKLIGSSNERMSVPVRFSRRTFLRFEIDPPPLSPQEYDAASQDTRKLGVFIGEPVRFAESPQSRRIAVMQQSATDAAGR